MATTVTRYSTVAVWLHWLIAALLIANVGLAWTFLNIPRGLTSFQLIQLHKSIGITVLLLSLVRLGWRLGHPAPPYPAGLPRWEKLAASAVQWGFYLVMIAMPLTGWVMTSASKLNLPTLLYGIVPWPQLPFVHDAPAAMKHRWDDLATNGHGLLAKLAYGLIALHVGAALKHQVLDRDVIMARMAPFPRRT